MMRHFLLFLILWLPLSGIWAQHRITGRIINAATAVPLPYVQITSEGRLPQLTNIDGTFSLPIKETTTITISYIGFQEKSITISPEIEFLEVRLDPLREHPVPFTTGENPADRIIQEAIRRSDSNDPEKALESFRLKSYNKFFIDNEQNNLALEADSTNLEAATIINTGAAFLSEKVSGLSFHRDQGRKESILGLRNAGFTEPVYEVLTLSSNPFSIYKKDYTIFETRYAGPLGRQALRNYQYSLLDTTAGTHPAYMIHFKPRREKEVAGLEGILYLDTTSYAVQEARAQLIGAIKLEIRHEFEYYKDHDLWFPKKQRTTIRPGTGGKNISVFGGVISVGQLQQGDDLLGLLLGQKQRDPDLFLTSSTTHYAIELNPEVEIDNPSAAIEIGGEAFDQDAEFWEINRQEHFGLIDRAREQRVSHLVEEKKTQKRVALKNAIASGHYPVGSLSFAMGKFFKFNNYEGIRVGLGGKTNSRFSGKFHLQGYGAFGTKDRELKFGLGAALYLRRRSGTHLGFYFHRDIFEVGSFDYLQGVNEFSLIEPRFVNINFFYREKALSTNLTHRFTSKFSTEARVTHSWITQTGTYAFVPDNRVYSDYELSQASLSFLWRPFGRFLQTTTGNLLLEKVYPKFTGQLTRGFSGLTGGDFDFTKMGLKVEYEHKRLDLSRTEIILEGNYATGQLPLTHAFHAYPNNPNRPEILRRFSVAGHTAFETMYYNEFFSDRQVMLHLKHQFPPMAIHRYSNPELVLIFRHVIGDFSNPEKHPNNNFGTLEHGFSEVGLELNNILAGLGLATAYRYGAYHLQGFKRNLAFKFTFQLKI